MSSTKKPSHASMLVALATNTVVAGGEWFVGTDGTPYVTLPNPTRSLALKSSAFKQWLAREFYADAGMVPSSGAVADAINTLCGVAISKAQHEVFLRVAGLEHEVFLDLGDEQHTILRVTKDGWGIAPGPSPKFIRKPGMLALPMPERTSERLDDLLRQFLNLRDERDVRMVIAWLVTTARGRKPYLVLVVRGAAGSAKSSCCVFVRDIIDPNSVNGGRPPKDTRDLMIAASSQFAVSLDNISFVKDEMSDDICSLVTGAGFRTRELTTDDNEKLFAVARPVVMNGIPDFLTRTDLGQRAAVVVLEPISGQERLTEQEARAQYAPLQPKLLGCVLDAVSGVLANPTTRPTSLPRMADVAVTMSAAESALGWPAGSFVQLLRDNEADTQAAILDNSVVYAALKKLSLPWAGETKHLKPFFPSDWGAKKIANEISRLDAALRSAGLHVVLPKSTDKRKELRDKRIVYVTSGPKTWALMDVVQQLEQRAEEDARRASSLPLGGDDGIPF